MQMHFQMLFMIWGILGDCIMYKNKYTIYISTITKYATCKYNTSQAHSIFLAALFYSGQNQAKGSLPTKMVTSK